MSKTQTTDPKRDLVFGEQAAWECTQRKEVPELYY